MSENDIKHMTGTNTFNLGYSNNFTPRASTEAFLSCWDFVMQENIIFPINVEQQTILCCFEGKSERTRLVPMEQIDDTVRNRIAALMRVFDWSKSFKEDDIPCKIEEGLFLGSLGAANNKSELTRLNVTHILTVANSLRPAHPDDFVYKIIPVMDRQDTDLRRYFDECFSFIDKAKEKGGGVLVHCFVGRSRSVTIVIAYLMKKHGMSLSQALDHVKSRRPQAGPNVGFMKQLQDFEKSLQSTQLFA